MGGIRTHDLIVIKMRSWLPQPFPFLYKLVLQIGQVNLNILGTRSQSCKRWYSGTALCWNKDLSLIQTSHVTCNIHLEGLFQHSVVPKNTSLKFVGDIGYCSSNVFSLNGHHIEWCTSWVWPILLNLKGMAKSSKTSLKVLLIIRATLGSITETGKVIFSVQK